MTPKKTPAVYELTGTERYSDKRSLPYQATSPSIHPHELRFGPWPPEQEQSFPSSAETAPPVAFFYCPNSQTHPVASSPPLALFFTNVRADAAASSSSDRPRSRLPVHFLLPHLSLSSVAATKPPPAAPTDPMARVHTSQRGERRRRRVGDSDFLPVN
jgi:hypothetical protein